MSPAPAVPRLVRWMLALAAPRSAREWLLADLQEEASARAARDGVRAARRWCWRQLAGSIGPLAAQRVSATTHSIRSVPMLFWRRLPHDLGSAIRRLAKSPGFTLVCLLTLSLGIGSTTAVFTLVQQVLLKSLPVERPGELYRLGDNDTCCVNGGLQGSHSLFSYDLYRHLRDHLSDFTSIAAFQANIGSITVRRGDSAPEPFAHQYVSGNYFRTFGIVPVRGRVLREDDDVPGAAPVAVISYRAWEQRFAADPAIVGAAVAVNGVPTTIVGVAPPAFYGAMLRPNPADFWIPMANEPRMQPQARWMAQTGTHWLYSIGRLRPGAGPTPAAGHATALLREWLRASEDVPAADRARIPAQEIHIVPAAAGVSNMRDAVAPSLKLLLAISAAVLVIACANLANLLLARGMGRRIELAVRTALGAPRGRLVAESMIESVVLACAGGLAGLLVAYEGARAIVAMAFRGARYIPVDATPSVPVLVFATVVSVATGIAFGIAPALAAARSDPIDAMRGAGRVAGDRSTRLRRALVAFQVALSLVLVACAGLLVRSLANLQTQDFGFQTRDRYVVLVTAALGEATMDRLETIYRALPDRVGRIPGVTRAAFSLYSPMEGDNWGTRITIDGHATSEVLSSSWNRVSAGYFDTIGTPLRRGRLIDARDTRTSPIVAVVNEAFARRFFGDADPIGKHFGFSDRDGGGPHDIEIVGLVGDAKYQNARRPAYVTFFLPFLQQPRGSGPSNAIGRSNFFKSIELRLDRPVTNLEADLRRALGDVDPGLTVLRVLSLEEQVARNFNTERLIATLTIAFGSMALLLACLGLYGVTAQFVVARTREIGVRMAMGATRGRVVAGVLRSALVQVGIGAAVGLPAAFAAGRLLEQQLYGVSAHDPRIIAGSAAVMTVCAAIAAIIPAGRAASIDPVRAIRAE